MMCPICKHGITENGTTTLVFEKGKSTIIIKNVPAEICENCGESFLSENVSQGILKLAEEGVSKGIEVEIFKYEPSFSFPS